MKQRHFFFIAVAFVLICSSGCESPHFYGDPAVLELISEGWDYFEVSQFPQAINSFTAALAGLEADTAILVDLSRADAHAGLGWSYLRSGLADPAMTNFDRSQELGLFNFGISLGRLGSFYELRETNPVYVDSAIATGTWIFSSDMPTVFEHDPDVDENTVRMVMAQCHLYQGDLDATLAMIVAMDSYYSYVDRNNTGTWNLSASTTVQEYDSFAELLLAILMDMQSIYPV